MGDVTDARTGVRADRASPIFDKDLNSSRNFIVERLFGELKSKVIWISDKGKCCVL